MPPRIVPEPPPPPAAAIEEKKAPRIAPRIRAIKPNKEVSKGEQVPVFDSQMKSGDVLSVGLLDAPESHHGLGYSAETLEQMSRDVEIHLRDFGVGSNGGCGSSRSRYYPF